MKAYWGSGGIAPSILDRDTVWRWVVSFMPQPLYRQGKSPWDPLDRRLGGPQSWSGSSSKPMSPKRSIPFRFSNQNFAYILISLMCYMWPTNLILLHMIILTSVELYKLWSSSICNCLQPPTISTLLGPNTLLSTLFSNTLYFIRIHS
jgi:hypothetical protein